MKWCKENHTGSLIEVLMKSDLDLRKKKKKWGAAIVSFQRGGISHYLQTTFQQSRNNCMSSWGIRTVIKFTLKNDCPISNSYFSSENVNFN